MMEFPFSYFSREQITQSMQENEYDVLIIGGGITGAGIALDAVTRGMKVALIEMQDFAAGTSSRSTKLVHGGLRYLKQFQVGLVAEVGKERAIVYENGPHVTTPEWMLLPFYKGGTFGKFTTSIGLKVYDFLAGVKKAERRKMLTREDTLKKEPLLKKSDLQGGGYYVEYRTDDARLTIEVMKAAAERGAHILNYTKAVAFLYENKKVTGIVCEDQLTKQKLHIKAKTVVNATGPWVDEVRNHDYSKNNKRLQLTKGVHVVIDQSRFPLHQAIYFDTPDGRMVFAIPRDGKTYVGTTDTFYGDDPIHPRVTKKDREYLLGAIDFMFPDVKITEDDIESSWAGVRPLIYEEGKDPSEISRKDEIWESDSGLITIAGGKLTGYRKMAEHVVDLVSKRLSSSGLQFRPCETKHIPISGGDVGPSSQFPSFVRNMSEIGLKYGFTKEEGEWLAKHYGSNVEQVFSYGKQYDESSRLLPKVLYTQLMYAIEHEMIVKPVDFFIRRTGYVYFDIHTVQRWKEETITLMAKIFNWSDAQTEEYRKELEQEIKAARVAAD
ncbi:glycerol-3-phosphate dehydrogenase/oxidase [Bacillus andreraoultii]|uniref:glycerol-3-phosphate dehydrogenase/oxidase n=1 Tax=Bacillus andreraoultii TaxID=1499685 RepID=UPI00053A77A3